MKAKNEEDLGFPLQNDDSTEKRNESFGLPLSTSYKVDNTQEGSEFGISKEANSMNNAFYRPIKNATSDINNQTMF